MVRLSEMDSGSIVFARRTGRGGKAGLLQKGGGRDEGGRAAAVPAMSRWEGGTWRMRGGGQGAGDGGRKTRVSRNFLPQGS